MVGKRTLLIVPDLPLALFTSQLKA
jgi:hypothetical protein